MELTFIWFGVADLLHADSHTTNQRRQIGDRRIGRKRTRPRTHELWARPDPCRFADFDRTSPQVRKVPAAHERTSPPHSVPTVNADAPRATPAGPGGKPKLRVRAKIELRLHHSERSIALAVADSSFRYGAP